MSADDEPAVLNVRCLHVLIPASAVDLRAELTATHAELICPAESRELLALPELQGAVDDAEAIKILRRFVIRFNAGRIALHGFHCDLIGVSGELCELTPAGGLIANMSASTRRNVSKIQTGRPKTTGAALPTRLNGWSGMPELAALLAAQPDVVGAVAQLDADIVDWNGIYIVGEYLEGAGTISRRTDLVFKRVMQQANHFRHYGSSKYPPPKKAVLIDEAFTLIVDALVVHVVSEHPVQM